MPLHIEFRKQRRLSTTFCQAVESAFELLPPYASTALEQNNFKIIIGNRMPSLHRGLRHGREYAGFCAPTIKAIFLAQSSYDCEAKEYIDAGEENPKHVVFHEVGHFIDMFVTGTGRYPEGYRSKKDDFSSAFKRDIGKTGKDVPSFLISQLADDPEYASYYWNFIRNKFMDGENSSEAYAELWAELNNGCIEDLPPINPLFPECRKIVAADIATLEKIQSFERD